MHVWRRQPQQNAGKCRPTNRKNNNKTTPGNFVGGAVFVSSTYALAFGTPNKQLDAWAARAGARLRGWWRARGRGVPVGGGKGRGQLRA